MAIQFELYKTPRPKDEEGKEMYHARVVNFQHIDTDYLAKEIQIATSLTEGDVKSVLESLSHFMGDRLREGHRAAAGPVPRAHRSGERNAGCRCGRPDETASATDGSHRHAAPPRAGTD